MKLYSPNNTLIIGTLEQLQGVALINNDDIMMSDGSGILQRYDLSSKYNGNTEIDWGTQTTVLAGMERVFVDDYGSEWRESELQLREAPEDLVNTNLAPPAVAPRSVSTARIDTTVSPDLAASIASVRTKPTIEAEQVPAGENLTTVEKLSEKRKLAIKTSSEIATLEADLLEETYRQKLAGRAFVRSLGSKIIIGSFPDNYVLSRSEEGAKIRVERGLIKLRTDSTHLISASFSSDSVTLTMSDISNALFQCIGTISNKTFDEIWNSYHEWNRFCSKSVLSWLFEFISGDAPGLITTDMRSLMRFDGIDTSHLKFPHVLVTPTVLALCPSLHPFITLGGVMAICDQSVSETRKLARSITAETLSSRACDIPPDSFGKLRQFFDDVERQSQIAPTTTHNPEEGRMIFNRTILSINDDSRPNHPSPHPGI